MTDLTSPNSNRSWKALSSWVGHGPPSVSNVLSFLAVLVAAWGSKISYDSLEESRRSLYQATRQADIAEDTARRQLRAYIGLSYGSYGVGCLNCEQSESGKLKISAGPVVYSLKNFGNTPASSLYVCSNLFVIRNDKSEKKIPVNYINECNQRPIKEKNILPRFWPGETRRQIGGSVDGITVSIALSGMAKIYHIIQIRYKDIYGNDHFDLDCRTISAHPYAPGEALISACDIDNNNIRMQ